jgi:hypothetical protein
MFFPKELDELLYYNGFKIIEKFGDYHETGFTKGSKTQIPISVLDKCKKS